MSTTTNYHWVKPTNGGDADVWGVKLNAAIDAIDASLKTVQDSIPGDPVPTGPVLLKNGNVSAGGTFLVLDLSTYLSSYKRFEIKLNSVNPGGSSAGAAVQFSTNKGSSWINSGYRWALSSFASSYVFASDGGTGDTQAKIQDRQAFIHGTLEFSIGATGVLLSSFIAGGAFTACAGWIGGSNLSASGINAIRLVTLGGSVTSGSYDLIGYP